MTKPQAKQDLSEVRCNVATIHIDAREVTLTQRKAFRILVYNAWDELEKNKIHVMGASQLAHMLGFHDIMQLKVELEKMPFIKVSWNILRDDGWPIDVGVCGLIAGFRMVGNQFRYSFFEDFRPHIRNPKVWTAVKIEISNLFTSNYALALYDQCCRFVGTGSTGFIEIEEWNSLLGVPETGLYKKWGQVNQRIIKPAIKQVNTISDIRIEPEYKRLGGGRGTGRSYSHLKFNVEKKKNYSLPERQLTLPIKKEQVAREIEHLPATSDEVLEGVRGWLAKMGHKPAPELDQSGPALVLKPYFVIFDDVPPEEIRAKLKEMGFRWLKEDRKWQGEADGNQLFLLVTKHKGHVIPAL